LTTRIHTISLSFPHHPPLSCSPMIPLPTSSVPLCAVSLSRPSVAISHLRCAAFSAFCGHSLSALRRMRHMWHLCLSRIAAACGPLSYT
ncbi:hypothetical protein C8R44DRAFT_813536, partial [Mycena epipterygia]